MRILTCTAALVIAGAATLTGCGNLSFGTHEDSRSYTAPSGVTALKISGGSRVKVTATDSSRIKVSERLRWSNEKNKPDAAHVTEGSTLKLTSKCAGPVIGGSACGVSYHVEIPRTVPVEIDNRDGSIVATGLGGTVKLHSDNGSITATDLRATSVSISSDDGSLRVSGRAATAELHSDDGSIDAAGLDTDRLSAGSDDGRIRLGGSVGVAYVRTGNGSIGAAGLTADNLTAETGDGSIELRFAASPANLHATTGNGSIRVGVPDDQSYAINVSTGNGGRRIDPSLHQDSQSPRQLTLKSGNGSITVTAANQRSW